MDRRRPRGRRIVSGSLIGYVLAGEEHSASALVSHGLRAEQVGFSFVFVSDHFHPWNHHQGHGSSIWPVLGALASSTSQIQLVSAAICPILRSHPTTLAQAAATVQALSGGRFVLGLGTGENLNEHIIGAGWPPFSERLARLAEAVDMLRELFTGQEVSRVGEYFHIHRARLFDPPDSLPIALAASGPRAAGLAGDFADGLLSLGADAQSVTAFDKGARGPGRPKLTQISVCWASVASEARETAHRLWPLVALEGCQFASLETPEDFEAACLEISPDDVAASIVCGADPEAYFQAIDECLAAGFDGVALHQIGPDQDGFFDFWQRELRPRYDGPESEFLARTSSRSSAKLSASAGQ